MKRKSKSPLSSPLVLAGAAALGYAGAKALRDIKSDRQNELVFKGKVAIVTGGASGIGRALCEALGQRDAVVVVADINAEGAGRVAAAITTAGGRARAAHLDVTQAEEVQKLVEETAAEHGRLDYVFNNAGTAIVSDMRDMDLEHWRCTLDVNLWGIIYGTMAAYQVMSRQGFGHIVNTASAGGLVPVPLLTAYATTKHAVIGLSTSLRAEAAPLGVKVSVVCPGLTRTGMFDTSTFVQINREEAISKLTSIFGIMDPANCARVILRGVARNKTIITVTALARLLWWSYRLHPALLDPLLHKMVEDTRALRSASFDDPPGHLISRSQNNAGR